MSHFCRLCAELKNPSELTTTINDQNLRISEKLIYCCRWNTVNKAEDLPQDVCSDCFEDLEKCWRFATRIQLAQKTLREICLAESNKDTQSTRRIKTGVSKIKTQAVETSNVNTTKVCSFAKQKWTEHPQVSAANISQSLKTGANNVVISDGETDEVIKIADIAQISKADANKEVLPVDDADEITNNNKSNEVLAKATKNNRKCVKDNFLRHLSKEHCNADGTITDEGVAKLNAHSWNDYRFKCLKCKEVSNGFIAFRSHIESIHSNEPPTSRYTCPDCPSKFVRFALFANHFGNMHRPNLKYCCFICSKFFWNVPLMKNHIYNHEDRTCICDLCGKSFKSKAALECHMNSHINHKPFSCDLCDKKFISRSHLKRHKAIHMDFKKYVCDICGKGFRLNTYLISHARIHSGALPYSCEFCDKKCRTTAALIIHRRIHTGERPFSCKDCNRQFANWCNYHKHRKRIHGTDTNKKKK